MCYYVDQGASRNDVKLRFNIAVNNTGNFYEGVFVNGFSFPNLPIITDNNQEELSMNYNWGLMPSWAGSKQLDFRKGKLNARIEDLNDKPSYRNITQNRCLIIATSYYEWRWLDPKGDKKEKYQIFSQYNEIFTFAGLYDSWLNPENGEYLNTFTMVTTKANDTMRFIHNHKERMPVMLKFSDEHEWLNPENNINNFAYPNYNCKLQGYKVA